MTITDYTNNYLKYDNMSIWEIKNLDDLFKAHESMLDIFEKEYGFPYSQLKEQRENVKDADIVIVSKLLDHFGDKHFFVFSYNDKHHNDLKTLQDKKAINFGIDIHVVNPQRIYVLEMDKTQDLKVYDTV
ncbi:MAG: hypothetical protein EPN85_09160 [Bacteroidetes bacterium]|nr:MAG: hypothetical protein EPN85_09160 [Bacteroidota bacterium]